MTNTPEEASVPKAFSLSLVEPDGDSHECVCALESFPAVLKKIFRLWGTREFDKLIKELILDSRDGSRQGFPMAAAEELLFLGDCNKYVRALDVSKNMNIDIKEAYRMVDSGDQAHLEADPWDDPSVSQESSHHQLQKQPWQENQDQYPGSQRSSLPKMQPNAAAPLPRNAGNEKVMRPVFWFCFLIIIIAVIRLLYPELLAY